MTGCEMCALREAGDSARADVLESIRGRRQLLAFLNNASGPAEWVGAEFAAEFGDCRECIARLAAQYLGMAAGALIHMAGNADEAAKWIERGLDEDLPRSG